METCDTATRQRLCRQTPADSCESNSKEEWYIYICVTFHAQHPSTPLCTHIVTHLFALGRVSDWLGPEFFDDVRSIEIGCPVRVLRPEDTAKFRNGYENSNMGESRFV